MRLISVTSIGLHGRKLASPEVFSGLAPLKKFGGQRIFFGAIGIRQPVRSPNQVCSAHLSRQCVIVTQTFHQPVDPMLQSPNTCFGEEGWASSLSNIINSALFDLERALVPFQQTLGTM